MKILFTGASSFTGYWFVKKLTEAGHEVICPLRGQDSGNPASKQGRLDRLQDIVKLFPETAFGSEKFLTLASEEQADILCHHAAEVGNYRSLEFDVIGALKSNALNLRDVIAAMNGKPLMITGSVFEQDEGDGGDVTNAFSSYGLSKGLTWQYFRYFCHAYRVPLGKFVIPNPFGPFEESRFTAYLMKTWKEGKLAEVKTPDYIRDNIPVDLLALAYCSYVEQTVSPAKAPGSLDVFHPSGYVGSQGDFVSKVADEVSKRIGWSCEFKLTKQIDFSEPMKRVNTQPQLGAQNGWNETLFWDEFAYYYQRGVA